MRLDRLVGEAELADLVVSTLGDQSVDIRGVSIDSRRVHSGDLFACVPGAQEDGHMFAPAAVAAGAVGLVVERPVDADVPQVVVAAVRPTLGPLAATLHGDPSADLTVVGVTGTNGKTTTAALLGAVFGAAGWPAEVIGTLTQARTTPEAPELQARLAELRDGGVRAVAMEVSSHALDQHRVDAVHFAAGVLTNVTQDHLDYHRTMAAYFEAKARLFDPGRCQVAVINRDDAWGRLLTERLVERGQAVVGFGVDEVDELELGSSGSRFRWHGQQVNLQLSGRFNVLNALAAATCARALGIDTATIAAGLASLPGVRGRFQRVEVGQDFTVVVDYAHTPDGLVQALGAARELAEGRVLVVFGAGGDRDHDKRPLMGAAATAGADLAVVTTDNPRHEDPAAIVEQILDGMAEGANVVVELDRARAIAAAVAAAGPGDVVLIAGKGHETVQELPEGAVHFDDAAVAAEALTRILASRRQRHGS